MPPLPPPPPKGSGRTVGKPRNALAEDTQPYHSGLGQNALAGLDMIRNDGTRKGAGWLGPRYNKRGQLMTEYSIGVGIDGREMEIPTMVPTLDESEVQYLLNMDEGMPIPPSIERKAIDHALERLRQGQNPFYEGGYVTAGVRRKF